MSLRIDLWAADGGRLRSLPRGRLDFEDRLEAWLWADPALSGMDVCMIGRQVVTPHQGRIDLLALDPDGNVVLFELKRDRTPRDVVAQTLDYASWIKGLEFGDLEQICIKSRDMSLREALEARFGFVPESFNDAHQLIIVASELDDSSERIVRYLAEEADLAINVVFFQVFEDSGRELVGRAWLEDPDVVTDRVESKRRAPWAGYWFVNVGEGETRSWRDARRYGFMAAGQGPKYSGALDRLSPGDPIFAYAKGEGFVGYGTVTADPVPVAEFRVDGVPILERELAQPGLSRNSDDPELAEHLVAVDWHHTVPIEDARWFRGAFANQNIACKLRHPETIRFLEREFEVRK